MPFNAIRLLTNLFGLPSFLAIVALWGLSSIEVFSHQAYLAPLAQLGQWISVGLLTVAGAMYLIGARKLWRSFKGVGENCYSCGMPTKLIDPGKYSPHYRCLACGANRRAYF